MVVWRQAVDRGEQAGRADEVGRVQIIVFLRDLQPDRIPPQLDTLDDDFGGRIEVAAL